MTVGYAAMLVVVATTLLILGPRVEDAVVSARGMARLRQLLSNETTPLYRHGCGEVGSSGRGTRGALTAVDHRHARSDLCW